MKHRPTRRFWEDYRKSSPELQEKAKKAFRLFSENPRHPSFQTHLIRGTKNPKLFEGYLDVGYRFTFHYEEDTIVYRRIGPHRVIDEEARKN